MSNASSGFINNNDFMHWGKKNKKKQLHVIFFLNTQTQDMNPKAQDMLRNGKDSTDKPTKLDQ